MQTLPHMIFMSYTLNAIHVSGVNSVAYLTQRRDNDIIITTHNCRRCFSKTHIMQQQQQQQQLANPRFFHLLHAFTVKHIFDKRLSLSASATRTDDAARDIRCV